ncbi:hypothetical protein ACCE111639_10875 [Acinetobacter celticus]
MQVWFHFCINCTCHCYTRKRCRVTTSNGIIWSMVFNSLFYLLVLGLSVGVKTPLVDVFGRSYSRLDCCYSYFDLCMAKLYALICRSIKVANRVDGKHFPRTTILILHHGYRLYAFFLGCRHHNGQQLYQWLQ